jgi:hypothetical protein
MQTDKLSSKYSEKLINDFIKEFNKPHGFLFSREGAAEALDNLANLFIIFSKVKKVRIAKDKEE